MQIHFQKTFPWGEPTYFVEKIWTGFSLNDFLWNERNGEWSTEPFKEKFPYNYEWFPIFMKSKPKLHTIREDKHDRWKPGKIIHFEQWTDKPYKSQCYHFAPLIPCTNTQKINIEWKAGSPSVWVDNKLFYEFYMVLHDHMLDIVKNDGFDSTNDFFRWFNRDFEGKIIHWTDLKY